ncbi:hypothetical protein ACA910_018183 [Epithemia clementina (nom. ined.)]
MLKSLHTTGVVKPKSSLLLRKSPNLRSAVRAICYYPPFLAFLSFTSVLALVPPQLRNISSMPPSTSTKAEASKRSDADADGSTVTVTEKSSSLDSIRSILENSWVKQLSPESPENLMKSRGRERLPKDDDNRTRRPVLNGHYVLVQPTGLRQPRLVLYSKDVAHNLLGLTTEQVESDEFLNWVSGNLVLGETWATPYALSIMGSRYTNNCPYGTGDGYGDGRAISIGEFRGHELQLKGAGTTPFHRGADGRAVLRSSIREFLASEAMHHLGIPTTRALSLIVSEKDTIQRPWYSEDAKLRLPDLDDPRLAAYPLEERKQIIQQLRHQKADPNILITEKAAITCRVAPSFSRIGHVDLFARRAERASIKAQTESGEGPTFDTSSQEWKELEDIIWHVCYREFRKEAYDPYHKTNDIAKAAEVMLNLSAEGIASMVAGWIRVGFTQGNFNADNNLIAGRTMDYGPFGWVEEYNPVFAKWTGSGSHFGFMNQPSAGYANYGVLVESAGLVISAARGDDSPVPVRKEFLNRAKEIFEKKIDEVFRIKLGFQTDHDVADDLWQTLEPLMRKSRTDWTVFWRRLAYILRDLPESDDYSAMFSLLDMVDEPYSGAGAFYQSPSDDIRQEWLAWLEQWRTALQASGISPKSAYAQMAASNPKYVLREWMLVDAYSSAANDEEAELFNLFSLIQRPYDEGSDFETKKYFRRAPDEALTTGGTAFMS